MAKDEAEQLREKLRTAEDEVNRLYGQRESPMSILQEFECDDIEQAKQLVKQMNEELAEMNKKYEKLVQQFKKKYAIETEEDNDE